MMPPHLASPHRTPSVNLKFDTCTCSPGCSGMLLEGHQEDVTTGLTFKLDLAF